MKYLIYIVLCISLICPFVHADTDKYALVKDGKIIKYKNVDASDEIIKSKLLAHDYLIVKEQEVPVYDYITQTLIDSYEIQVDKVLRVWIIEERTFKDSKQNKVRDVENKILGDIQASFSDINEQTLINQALITKNEQLAKVKAAKNNADLRDIKEAK